MNELESLKKFSEALKDTSKTVDEMIEVIESKNGDLTEEEMITFTVKILMSLQKLGEAKDGL